MWKIGQDEEGFFVCLRGLRVSGIPTRQDAERFVLAAEETGVKDHFKDNGTIDIIGAVKVDLAIEKVKAGE